MMVLQNCKHDIQPLVCMSREQKRLSIVHNAETYNLNDGLSKSRKGYKPRKPVTNVIGKSGRKLGDFSDGNGKAKNRFSGSQKTVCKILISLPIDTVIKFIGYDKSSCTVYKTVINGKVNYHYRVPRMKRRTDLPIDYYYIAIGKSEREYQSITCHNLVRFLTTVLKYQ